MALPEINFLYIQAGDGTTGTTGDQLEARWSTNFNMIKTFLKSLDEDIQTRIMSKQIKEIKVDRGVAYFTVNGTDWVSLGPAFSNISGSPDDCAALVEKFSNYVTTITFNVVSDKVDNLETDIVTINNTLNVLGADVDTLKNEVENVSTGLIVRVTEIENEMNTKITSSTVIAVREVAEGMLEYTTNGTTWHPVASTLGIDWGQIFGDIGNQADLMNRFDVISDRLTDVELALDGKIDVTPGYGLSQNDFSNDYRNKLDDLWSRYGN